MKKILSVILIFTLILSLNVYTNVFSEESVIFSDSFEDGLNNWSTKGEENSTDGRIVRISSDRASHGSQSVYVYDELTNNYAGIIYPRINLTTFRKYTFSADFYAIKNSFTVKMRCYNASGTQIETKSISTSTTNQWETLTINVTASIDVSYIRLELITQTAKDGEGYIDNVKVTDIGEIPLEEQMGATLYQQLVEEISQAEPGDVIEIEDGTYHHVAVNFAANGTAQNPITIKAKNPGNVILKGNSSITMTGSYLNVEGIVFENCTSENDIIHTSTGSSYCTIKDCVMLNCNPENLSINQRWVGLYGQYHKVTNCYFRGKQTGGMMLEVVRPDSSPNYITVENCYFGDYEYGDDNGFETLRIGTSSQYDSGSYSIVRNCFFEECNGEVEIISIKSGNNQIYNNTFYNCDGAVYSRHGNNNEFFGNLFVGGVPTTRNTGIVLYGDNHKVSDNYFYNLPRTSGAVVVKDGNPHPDYTGHLQAVTNMDLSNNTVIGCDLGFKIGEYSPDTIVKENSVIPPQGTVEKNALISYKGVMPQILNGDSDDEITYQNNYVMGKRVGYDGSLPEGILYSEAPYTFSDGFIVFHNGIGADIAEVKKAPENPFEIITDWVKEDLYETNIVQFIPVKGDFLNTSFNIEDSFPSDDKINIMINGLRVDFDTNPYIKNGEIMVPATEFFENVGGTTTVSSSYVNATKGDITLKFTKDSSMVTVSKKSVDAGITIDYADGEFFIPLSFTVRELCGYYSFLDDNTGIITLNITDSSEDNEVFLPEDESDTNDSDADSSQEVIYFDDLTNIKRVDNLIGLDYDNFVIATARYNKASTISETDIEYGIIASSDTTVTDLTVDNGTKFVAQNANDGIYAVALCDVPDTLVLRPYALYDGEYYYGNSAYANKPDNENAVATPNLTYQNDYVNNVLTVSWDTDINATDYVAEVYADGVKLNNGYDESDIRNGMLYITNVDSDSHYSSVYTVRITGIGNSDNSIVDSSTAEIIIDNTAITGTGVESDPYIIRSGKQFAEAFGKNALADNMTKYFRQSGSIKLSDYTPLEGGVFRGVYDGNDEKITVLSYIPETSRNGLVESIGTNGQFKDLTVAGTIDALDKTNTGAITGYLNGGSIINCVNEASVYGKTAVGGLVGLIQNGSVESSVNKGSVTARSGNAGGIVGYTNGSSAKSISNCANYGEILGGSTTNVAYSVGGIIGSAGGNITIENSFNAGNVEIRNGIAGAIAGTNYASANTTLTVTNCFNTGVINSTVTGGSVIMGSYTTPNSGKTFAISVENFYDISNHELTGLPLEVVGDDNVSGVYILSENVTADTILTAYEENTLYDCTASDGYDYPDFDLTDDITVSYDYESGGIFKIGNTEDGSYFNPWVIDSADDFIAIFGENSDASKLSDHFIQTADIELPASYRAYRQGITHSSSATYFSGVYNGNGHSIDLAMTDLEKTGNAFAGVFSINKGTVKNLKVTGFINIPNGSYVGGIAGWNYGRVENCINEADITAKGTVGGIVGKSEPTVLSEILSGCINRGDIYSASGEVGGIIGSINCRITVSDCANYGNISGNNRVGGIVGGIRNKAVIKNCFNAGEIQSVNKDAAAIVGNTASGKSTLIEIYDCFNTGEIIGNAYSTGLAFGTISVDAEKGYRFIINNVYDVSESVVRAVYAGNEYYFDNVYMLERNGATNETINEYFGNKDGWVILDGYEYPQLESVPYNP